MASVIIGRFSQVLAIWYFCFDAQRKYFFKLNYNLIIYLSTLIYLKNLKNDSKDADSKSGKKYAFEWKLSVRYIFIFQMLVLGLGKKFIFLRQFILSKFNIGFQIANRKIQIIIRKQCIMIYIFIDLTVKEKA